jgi:hypothetical protein
MRSWYPSIIMLACMALLPGLGALPASAGTVVLDSIADAHVKSHWDFKDQNFGSDPLLQSGHICGFVENALNTLVRFSQSGLLETVEDWDVLVSAHLELYISSASAFHPPYATKPAHGYIDVHRLTSEWAEGTVTWDYNSWNGGDFFRSATDGLLYSASSSGTVRYDVTADVEAMVAATVANHGWVVKTRTGTGGACGTVSYHSREAAGALPPGAHIPRLVLDLEDNTAPEIVPEVDPEANLAGWNNTDVSVGFECTDTGGSGLASCTSPIQVTTESSGEQVTGFAEDGAGNSASASVTLRLDKTAPALEITAQPDGAIVDTPAMTVAGTASDALSGLQALLCDTTPAQLTDGSFSCELTLEEGENVISVHASDVAGNTTSSTITVTYDSRPRPPGTFHINQYGKVYVLIGESDSPNVDHYNLYRQTGNQQPQLLETITHAEVAAKYGVIYKDESPPTNIPLYYFVTAADSAGIEGTRSALRGAFVPSGPEPYQFLKFDAELNQFYEVAQGLTGKDLVDCAEGFRLRAETDPPAVTIEIWVDQTPVPDTYYDQLEQLGVFADARTPSINYIYAMAPIEAFGQVNDLDFVLIVKSIHTTVFFDSDDSSPEETGQKSQTPK